MATANEITRATMLYHAGTFHYLTPAHLEAIFADTSMPVRVRDAAKLAWNLKQGN